MLFQILNGVFIVVQVFKCLAGQNDGPKSKNKKSNEKIKIFSGNP